jgi:hypothetical protein
MIRVMELHLVRYNDKKTLSLMGCGILAYLDAAIRENQGEQPDCYEDRRHAR